LPPARGGTITISVVWFKTASTSRELRWYMRGAMVEIRTGSPVHDAVWFTSSSFKQGMEACVRDRVLSAL
jgi:hypothetical protein